ncbi:uncharacterized protein LOC111069224 [Drosophila obscura]|uniref:uncharacterized protein LOC111069224 n=1 Tax=Drosophila obscura TaxID=7282 RepID=UPI001BB2AF30|nr:uncharacterized protein LOC111069224 [Drosophila obscura]
MSCPSPTPTGCDCGSTLQFKKTPQAPLYDLLGPYPDEIIMSTLDRILYYSGATKVIRMLAMSAGAPVDNTSAEKCATTSCGAVPSPVCPSTSATTCCSRPPSCSSHREVPLAPCKPKPPCINMASKKPACCNRSTSCFPRRRSPRVDFANPVDDCGTRNKGGEYLLGERTKESLSACPLAYERLKSKLSSGASLAPSKTQKWLWTRLVSARDGYMVYEVYKDSNADQDPRSQIADKGSPVIIFLVLPNGFIMPFESIFTD